MSWLSRWDRRNQQVVDEQREQNQRVVASPVGDRYYELEIKPDIGIAEAFLLEGGLIGMFLGIVVEFSDWLFRRRHRQGNMAVLVRSARTGKVVVSQRVHSMAEAEALVEQWSELIRTGGPDAIVV